MPGRGPYSDWARMISWARREALDIALDEGRGCYTIGDVYDDPFLEESHCHGL